jgi:HD-GYP domain-containing protein (c-di-GMP phosphodiesterase class II)
VEAFATAESVAQAYAMARRRSGRWFDPELVRALETFEHDSAFWARLAEEPDPHLVASLEPEGAALEATEERIDLVAWAFAGIIDAKSPFTFRHSTGVCRIALAIGARLGLQREEARDLMRVALLHDIGKLGVPNTILDKPGRLTPEEMAIVRRHPVYSEEILERVAVFRHLAPIAGAHHERLDGQGYPRGLSLATADRLTRILPVADVFEALTADRPYRPALPTDRALAVLREGSGRAYWPEAVTVLAEELASGRLVRTAGEWHDPGATA